MSSLRFGIVCTCTKSLNLMCSAFSFFFNPCSCFSCASTNWKNFWQMVHVRTMIKRFIWADFIFPKPKYDRRSKNMMPYPMVWFRASPHMASSSNSSALAQRFLSSRWKLNVTKYVEATSVLSTSIIFPRCQLSSDSIRQTMRSSISYEAFFFAKWQTLGFVKRQTNKRWKLASIMLNVAQIKLMHEKTSSNLFWKAPIKCPSVFTIVLRNSRKLFHHSMEFCCLLTSFCAATSCQLPQLLRFHWIENSFCICEFWNRKSSAISGLEARNFSKPEMKIENTFEICFSSTVWKRDGNSCEKL